MAKAFCVPTAGTTSQNASARMMRLAVNTEGHMAETIEAPAPVRRKRGKSPTARSLEFLRKSGDPAVVEKHSPFGGKFGKKHDLWGYIDILSLPYDGSGIIGVQTTSGSNVAARRSKIMGITPAGATDKEKAEAARIRARA